MKNRIDLISSNLTVTIEGEEHTVSDDNRLDGLLERLPRGTEVEVSFDDRNLLASLAAAQVIQILEQHGLKHAS